MSLNVLETVLFIVSAPWLCVLYMSSKLYISKQEGEQILGSCVVVLRAWALCPDATSEIVIAVQGRRPLGLRRGLARGHCDSDATSELVITVYG